MTNTKVKRTALDRQMDKIRDMEESGKLTTKLSNRALRKLSANKLAVLGIVLFFLICLFFLIRLLFLICQLFLSTCIFSTRFDCLSVHLLRRFKT